MGDPGLPKGCLVLLLILGAALAYENDDLVFDQDGKQSLGETPLIESRHHDSLLHRIKRQFFSFFAPATTTTTTTTTTEATPEANDHGGKEDDDDVPVELLEEKKPKGNVGVPSNLVRQTRESAEENEEAVEGNEIGNAAEARREPAKFGNTDDEDLAGSGDIEGSATSELGPHVKFPVTNNAQRRYYRITLTIGEPYLREYADRHSREYKELSGNLTHAFEELLNRHLAVESHHANVVKISPTSTDSFASLVTLDIGSTVTDEAEVRDIIEEQLQLHSLGNIQLHPDDFSFRIFQGCSAGEFACDVSRCILESERCNFVENCRDGSDEHDCNYPACTSTQFKCRNGQCIDFELHCNGARDCLDNSDERNCLTTCSSDQFRCSDGTCVNINKRCDNVPDCRNGEDEQQCECPNGQKPCDNGVCINKEFFCDNNQDCLDNSDERNCPDPDGTDKHPQPVRCQQDEFSCRDGRTCIPSYAVCDGSFDCPEEDDEFNCPEGRNADRTSSGGHPDSHTYENQAGRGHKSDYQPPANLSTRRSCAPDDFVCADGTCIPEIQHCDHFYDCRDFTDEQYCFG